MEIKLVLSSNVHSLEKIFFGWKLCEWAGQEMHLVNSVLSLCGSKAKTSLVLQCACVSVNRQSVC